MLLKALSKYLGFGLVFKKSEADLGVHYGYSPGDGFALVMGSLKQRG
jgi:hypothetical protein